MPVRSDGNLQRRGPARRPGRLTRSRIVGLVLLCLGLLATTVSLASVVLR